MKTVVTIDQANRALELLKDCAGIYNNRRKEYRTIKFMYCDPLKVAILKEENIPFEQVITYNKYTMKREDDLTISIRAPLDLKIKHT